MSGVTKGGNYVVQSSQNDAEARVAKGTYAHGLSWKFWYHPSRQPQVDLALFNGSLEATTGQLRPFAWMPLEDAEGKALLGYWVDERSFELTWPASKPLAIVDDRNDNPYYAAWKDV